MNSETVEVREVSPGYGFMPAKPTMPAGYKQTEAGVVPEDWNVLSLDELSDFTTSGSRGWAAYYSEHGALFIRSQNVRSGRLDFRDSRFVKPPQGAEGSRTRAKRDDVLITITGNNVGNVALVEQDFEEAYISQHVGLVRLKNPQIAQYVCRFLSPSAPGNLQIWASQSGQSKPGLTLQNLHGFIVALPPTQYEQHAISTALSEVDALLEGLDRLIAKKRDIKQATLQQLLTGQTRLPGFEEEWEVKRLGDLAEIVMGQSPSSSNYNVRGKGLPLIQGNADIADRCAMKRIFTTQITKRGQAGDILLSVRAPVGEVSKAGFDVCLGRGVCAIRFPNNFLYHYLIFLEPTWSKHSKGSTFDSVNSTDVKALDIEIPSDVSEQEAIAAVLSDLDADLEALTQRRAKTAAIKQAMMQALLSGRIRLV
ncbi:restriction endonuclease subunit S [Vreelandella titanicae]|uniref:restriction endonuclease subunit S n=1 Tax=Vreelandella titanicae TaxID=664683 RepID=UPI003D00079E